MTTDNSVTFFLLFAILFVGSFFLPDTILNEAFLGWFSQLVYSYLISAVFFVLLFMCGYDENSMKPVQAFNDGCFKGRHAYTGAYKYAGMERWEGKTGFLLARIMRPVCNAIGIGVLGIMLISGGLVWGWTLFLLLKTFVAWVRV